MFKRIIIVFCFGFLIGSTPDLFNLQILATTNNNGEIEPCGWKKKPLGGLARKATIVDEEKQKNDNVIILDAGNLFFKKNQLSDIDRDGLKINARIIRDAYNTIGCNAFNPGEKDFAAGLDYLLELKKESKFSYISANIFSLDGQQVFNPYKIVEINDRKVALIGLSSVFNHKDLNIKDPISTLDNLLSEIKMNHKTDINILLFHANAADMKKLHQHDFDIDLIVQSKDQKLASNGGDEEIAVFSCGSRGKYLYSFNMDFNDPSQDFIDLSKFENKISLSNKKLKRMKKGNFEVSLEELYSEDNNKLQQIKKLKETIVVSEAKLQNNGNTIKFSKIELNKKVADRPDILKIVDDGKVKINDIMGPILPIHVPHDHNGDGIPDH